MAYYTVCPDCGAHLDPGEQCDCETKKAAAKAAANKAEAENKDN